MAIQETAVTINVVPRVAWLGQKRAEDVAERRASKVACHGHSTIALSWCGALRMRVRTLPIAHFDAGLALRQIVLSSTMVVAGLKSRAAAGLNIPRMSNLIDPH
jgi:hypothetical protein